MKISANWLRDYINTGLSDDEIAEKLTLTGLEVEEVTQTGSNFDGIVVGDVLKVEKHPNADKLVLCQVNIGEETVQIVCGAPNVAAGQKVPVAQVGSVLPLLLDDGSFLKIKKSKIRGEVSFGMICAEDELGLGTDHSGIMVLDASLKPGTPFSEIVGSTKDAVLEIGLTPNRPDAACHAGTARDLHAVTSEALTIPAVDTDESNCVESGHPSVSISIEDTELCHRYVGVVMHGIKVTESPKWVQNRLKAIGLRPRNAIVDATNYVLHELGQPLHAFDLHELRNSQIVVKTYSKETEFTTLDEVDRKVPAGSLFICDGERPVALAGIMGGMNSEISEKTKDILIESAWFEPVSIRKTSKSLALQSDSSYRFERGVDPEITRKAALRCAQLISEWGGGEIEYPVVDVHPVKYQPATINLRPARLNQILGTQLSAEEMTEILNRLGFETSANGEHISCSIPGFRPDISEEIDLIEEVARIYDYNRIPTTGRITFARPPILPFEENFVNEMCTACVSFGLQEIYTNSLLPEKSAPLFGDENTLVPTLNPISKDQAVLRPSLTYGFLKSASWNFNRKTPGVSFFEIGHTFSKGDGKWIKGIDERQKLLIGLGGVKQTEHWSSKETGYTFADLRKIIDALLNKLRLAGKSAIEFKDEKLKVSSKGKVIAVAGKVEQSLLKEFDIETDMYTAEFDLGVLAEICEKLPPVRYEAVPKFPSFEFDLAVVVAKSVPAGDLLEHIQKNSGKALEDVDIFDVFEGKPLEDSEKSLAFRLRFRDKDKTLAIQDVQPVIEKLIKGLEKSFNAVLRG